MFEAVPHSHHWTYLDRLYCREPADQTQFSGLTLINFFYSNKHICLLMSRKAGGFFACVKTTGCYRYPAINRLVGTRAIESCWAFMRVVG